jgi:hypothetical protein
MDLQPKRKLGSRGAFVMAWVRGSEAVLVDIVMLLGRFGVYHRGHCRGLSGTPN